MERIYGNIKEMRHDVRSQRSIALTFTPATFKLRVLREIKVSVVLSKEFRLIYYPDSLTIFAAQRVDTSFDVAGS